MYISLLTEHIGIDCYYIIHSELESGCCRHLALSRPHPLIASHPFTIFGVTRAEVNSPTKVRGLAIWPLVAVPLAPHCPSSCHSACTSSCNSNPVAGLCAFVARSLPESFVCHADLCHSFWFPFCMGGEGGRRGPASDSNWPKLLDDSAVWLS